MLAKTFLTTTPRVFRSHVQPVGSLPPKSVPVARGDMDSAKFLQSIGRGCDKFTDKITDWNTLFTLTSGDMKHKLSIPTDQRKWILAWTEKYRQGIEPHRISASKRHGRSR